ncbi:LPS export ABC transporter periplasmic protein LptC [Halocynthiibacter sp.]|uniref:LPS export ABC transporter periplasmic protein LptC n=1 Tax=Halocynthiibacter sp. TaxID=1979210 RepID=UPI003C4B280F
MNNTNSYSRFVAWVKILLPLTALALLSTMFLFSRGTGEGGAIPFTERDIEERAQTPRATNPNFTGVTQNGTALSIQARTATPDPTDPRLLDAEGLRAAIDTPSGTRFDIMSDQGHMNGAEQVFTLTGDVEIESSAGMRMTTGQLDTAMDGSVMNAPGPVSVTGRFGSFDANSMELAVEEPGGNTYVLVFKGGVKLVYTPQN